MENRTRNHELRFWRALNSRSSRWWIAACLVLLCAAGFQTIAAMTNDSAKRGTGMSPVDASKTSQAEQGGKADSKSVPLVIVSEFTDADVVPDGNLGEFWANAKRIRFNEAAFTRKKYPKAETTVASRWSANYLYLAFWCHYQTLNVYKGEDPAKERWGLWERDVVEAFINPRPETPSHYYEFEVAPTNQWIDLEIHLHQHPFNNAKWNSGFEHATRIDAAHHIWTAEMRIPIHSMKVKEITPGTEWKLNFYRDDGPGTGYARRKMSWGPLPSNLAAAIFHQPASFGTIRFVGPGE